LNLKCDILVSNFAFKWVNLCRYAAGFAYASTSDDKGETWTEPESTGIDTPDSKTQLSQLMGKQYSKGPLLLAYNAHKRQGWHFSPRFFAFKTWFS
jgi:hypothetical protein